MDKNEYKWKDTDKRFVCFIDLLGFKDKIMRKSHNEIFEELGKISNYRKRFEKDRNGYFKNCRVHMVSFSDSIVVFSENDSWSNFEYFVVAIRYILANSIKSNIAMKGGVAYGEISINKKDQIFFGQPIIDAYLMEEEVNYLGIVFHNSIDLFLSKNKEAYGKSPLMKEMLFECKTPLKCGFINHLNLDWFSKCVDNRSKPENIITIEVVEKLKSFYASVSGSPRKYIENSLDLFCDLVKNNNVNLKKISLPKSNS